MSSFVGLWTGYSGLQASQIGLDTTTHNVANAHTAGYTRQRIEQSARMPYASPVGPLGTGVQVDDIARVRDAFLDTRARTTLASAASDTAHATLLERAEAVLAEPDHGLSAALEDVWDAFEDLAMHPTEPATRQQAVAALQTVAGRVDAIATGWEALQRDTEQQLTALVTETDGILKRVQAIQVQVLGSRDRPVPGDLMDERDLLLDRLVEITGATVTADPDDANGVVVRLGGLDVLRGDTLATLDETWPGLGGELGGTKAGLADLQTQFSQLDGFVTQLVDAINGRHGAPALLSTVPAGPGQQAGRLQVDGANLSSGDPANPFDGQWAADIAELRSSPLVATNPPRTLAASWSGVVVGLATDVQDHRRAADAQGQIAAAAGRARMSVHGVSIDEEMVQMVQYQRALEASSRIMTAVDEALDVLINRTGLVGR